MIINDGEFKFKLQIVYGYIKNKENVIKRAPIKKIWILKNVYYL